MYSKYDKMINTPNEPMVVDESANSVVCTLAKDIEVLLHPLVVLNLSDHFTRKKVQQPTIGKLEIFGALLGHQDGRHLEIINSFELKVFDTAGNPTIDSTFIGQRIKQYTQVFSELEVIGLYTNGEGPPTETELGIQQSCIKFVESPLFLKLDTTVCIENTKKLPVTIWENVPTHGTIGMRQIPWSLVSEESERIGVEHVNRFSSRPDIEKETVIAKTIRSNNNAVSMLVTRVQIIRDYIIAVHEGRLALNEDIIREVNKLCQMIQRINPDDFCTSITKQEEDVNVTLLLSRMTEISGSLNELMNRVTIISSDRSPGAVSKPGGIINAPHIYI